MFSKEILVLASLAVFVAFSAPAEETKKSAALVAPSGDQQPAEEDRVSFILVTRTTAAISAGADVLAAFSGSLDVLSKFAVSCILMFNPSLCFLVHTLPCLQTKSSPSLLIDLCNTIKTS